MDAHDAGATGVMPKHKGPKPAPADAHDALAWAWPPAGCCRTKVVIFCVPLSS